MLDPAVAALWSLALLSSPEPAPRPVPGPLVDGQYGLMVPFPDGSTYCPLPEDWTGSFHGYGAFLTPPASCAPGREKAFVARGDAREATPALDVFYYYDANPRYRDEAGFVVEGEDLHHPSDLDLLAKELCRGAQQPLPPGLVLFGQPAVGRLCRGDHGWLTVRLVAVFNVDWIDNLTRPWIDLKPTPATRINALLYIDLITTQSRLGEDLPKLRALARGTALCDPPRGLVELVDSAGHVTEDPGWHRPNPSAPCAPITWPNEGADPSNGGVRWVP